MRRSIRTRLTFTFIALAVGPLLLVGAILGWRGYNVQREQAQLLQREMAAHIATQVTAFFGELEDELRVVSRVQGLPRLDRDRQRTILSELLSYQHAFEELTSSIARGRSGLACHGRPSTPLIRAAVPMPGRAICSLRQPVDGSPTALSASTR